MQLIKINTNQIENYNFLNFKNTYLKTWIKENTCRHEKVNTVLQSFIIQFNHTKNTVTVNGKTYNIKQDFSYIYSVKKSKKEIFCSSLLDFQKFIIEAGKENAIFKNVVIDLLVKLAR